MAGKITIRRIGSMLPGVCLLLALLVGLGVVALSTLGFPSPVLRYIERRAAEQGITLRVEDLRLYPSRGLAVRAEGVTLYADATATTPLATIPALSAGLSSTHLLTGQLRPAFVRLVGGQVELPTTEPEGKSLSISEITLAARFDRGTRVQISSGFMRVQGIAVRVQGAYDLSKLSAAEGGASSSEPVGLPELLAKYQGYINKIYHYIELQQWEESQLPVVHVQLEDRDELCITVESQIPSLNIGQYHFRDIHFNLRHSKDTITINSLNFSTVDPKASAAFHGSYDLTHRHLTFDVKSTAALLRMVRSMSSGSLKAYLEKFRHEDDSPPNIDLEGNIVFEEDYSLQSARVRGSITQKDLRVGSSLVNSAQLSFYYNNGDYNIDNINLEFEDGSIRGSVTAQQGVGQAQLVFDMPVQRVLTLVRELVDEEVELPKGLELGQSIQLQAHAVITAPAFKPGQTRWQGFVPTLHNLALECRTDSLSYGGYSLQAPLLSLHMGDISQRRRNLSLRSLGNAQVLLSADVAQVEHEHLLIHKPVVALELGQLTCTADLMPREVGKAAATLRSGRLTYDTGSTRLEIEELKAEVELTGLNVEGDAPCAHGGSVKAELHQVAAADSRCEHISLNAENKNSESPRTLRELLLTSCIYATAKKLERGDTAAGDMELAFTLPRKGAGIFSLQLAPEEGKPPFLLTAVPAYDADNNLKLSDIKGDIPLAALALVPALFNIEVREVELPEIVRLSGSCELVLEPFDFLQGDFVIDVPELVRTPWRQSPLAGKRVPLSLHAEAFLNRASEELFTYRIALTAKHVTGEFNGLIVGSSAKALRVTGSNTIRPDIVDQLIDSEDAHSIIRDFRFPANGRAEIRDIDVSIDYSNGLRVDSVCNVELHNTEYLISVITETSDGERMRNDMGANPYTLVDHATCTVLVHVLDGSHTPDDKPIPNEGIVTINNAVLDYNNTPWLRRQGWSKGARSSRLEGRSIIIDIERSFVELNGVHGTVYPAYSLGMFYPDLQVYMEDVRLPSPVQVESDQCVFPIYSDCKRPMSGVIRVLSPGEAGFRFLGTTIPLNDFSGFVSLTDDYVLLDRMNARSWRGVLNAAVKIGISSKQRTSFDGYANAECMNLRDIAKSYGSKQADALCSGNIRFRSPSANLKDLRAYGRVDVENGDLMTLSLFHPVSDLITDLPGHFMRLEKEVASATGRPEPEPGFFTKLFGKIFKGLGIITSKTSDGMERMASNVPGMNHLIAYDLQEAHTDFDIANGFLVTRGMKVKGYNLNVRLNLAINLNTLELSGNLWPRISSLPTILLMPFTFLSDFVLDIIIYGKVDDIKWRIGLDRRIPTHPASATTEPDKESPKPRRRSAR